MTSPTPLSSSPPCVAPPDVEYAQLKGIHSAFPVTPPPSSPSNEGLPSSRPKSITLDIPYVLQAGSPSGSPSPVCSSPRSTTNVAELPSVSSLELSHSTIAQPHSDPNSKIAWCRDVLFLLSRDASLEPDAGPTEDLDASLLTLVASALLILDALSPNYPEATFLHATLAVSGAVPRLVPHNRPLAFREFEASAKTGYSNAWFNLGREYEAFGDIGLAMDCFERGVALDVTTCVYRMGMAHLLGQLDLPQNIPTAIPLLQKAATHASFHTPYPAYTFALILLGEFELVTIPQSMWDFILLPQTSRHTEAKSHLERAAFFHYPPAQYKLGHVYEHAQYPWPYDPLMSVEWYSKSGTKEAEMALSKWFLCGADGAFERDENLARVFAEKAATKGLVSAEFAVGYYNEVGVARMKDINMAISWYNIAASHGSIEATGRLHALNLSTPAVITRVEHETLAGEKLVRRRTKAKMDSEARSNTFPVATRHPSRRVLENIRKETVSECTHPMTPPKTPSPPPNTLAPQMVNRQRFSLVDPGFSNEGDGVPRSPLTKPRYTSPHPPGRRSFTPVQTVVPPRKTSGPSTFAEMGIGSTTMSQADKSDCVVM